MKVIDLLNKIANGEKVPDAIKWGCHEFDWIDYDYEYEAKGELGDPTLLDYLSQCPRMLNDEIITFYKVKEEKKIPEKLDLYEEVQNIIRENNYKLVYHDIHKCIVSLECKYNEIIDYLESKGE